MSGKHLRKPFYKAHPAGTAAFLLVIVVLCGWFVRHSAMLYREKKAIERQLAERQNGEALPAFSPEHGGILELDGKNYRRNTAIRAILCLGVDTSGELEQYQVSGVAGQADSIFLVAQDMMTDTVQILMIPRDTMTEITLFDYFGNELGKGIQHLNLAFAYGDGREKSCELTAEAVSDLLYGLKIDGYFTFNLETIRVLNDEVGGVEVTVEDKSLAEHNPDFVLGQSMVLKGSQAETYIRYRDINQYRTALTRLERQKGYMKAYIETAKQKYREDDQLIVRLVDDVEQYTITNMAKDQYMDMGLAVLNSPQVMEEEDFITVPGEVKETDLYEEYYPDKVELKKLVVEMFYKEIK